MSKLTRLDRPGTEHWTAAQRQIIEAPVGARLVVEAAPGTGKTAVACARVAWLLKEGVGPSNIWLLSFTRTAVQELVDRIRKLASDDEKVFGVKIATVDSYAWQLRQGFEDSKSRGFGTFDQGIVETLALLRAPSDELRESLASLEHFILDEAQDVVGLRADLIQALVGLLKKHTGITILHDPAQAIYEFAEQDEDDEPGEGEASSGLISDLCESGGFTSIELTDVIRAGTPGLQHIFVKTRKVVLNENGRAYSKVLEEIREHADEEISHSLAENSIARRQDVLVLYRNRAEVLMAAGFFAGEEVPFRIRMSGYPVTRCAWLGRVFWDWVNPNIGERAFLERWQERLSGVGGAENAWDLLRRFAKKPRDLVDVRHLRTILARPTPPVDFIEAEYGLGGPIIGTIHASKGREAEEVHLMLPGARLKGTEFVADDEETRVLFVGATRARKALKVGKAFGADSAKLASGRRYRFSRKGGGVQTELGRAGDLDELSLVERRDDLTAAAAELTQRALLSKGNDPWKVQAINRPLPNREYRWSITDPSDGLLLGFLATQFDKDLWQILKHPFLKSKGPLRPPAQYGHLRILGTRTVVREPDSPELQHVHEPWATSGFWMAPNIWGYSPGYPKQRASRGK